MTTSQNPCPALAGIAKAILTNLSAEDLADVLKSVESAVMQEALVRSEIVGMNPSHLQLAIDHELITKETILETIGHAEPSLTQVLSERTVHEIMDVMDGLHDRRTLIESMAITQTECLELDLCPWDENTLEKSLEMGICTEEGILQALGLDGGLIGPNNEIDTDLVVSRLSESDDGLETLMGSVYGHHDEDDIMDALLSHVSTGAILDTFDSSDLGEAAGEEWRHEDDMSDSWLCDRLDRDIVIRYLRENL